MGIFGDRSFAGPGCVLFMRLSLSFGDFSLFKLNGTKKV